MYDTAESTSQREGVRYVISVFHVFYCISIVLYQLLRTCVVFGKFNSLISNR